MKIGILGGGQLARMFYQEAINYDIMCSFLDSDTSPISNISPNLHVGDYNDYECVFEFGIRQDIITIEIENVDIEALYQLQRSGRTVLPQPRVLELIRNKVHQKKFYNRYNIPTASFVEVSSISEIIDAKFEFPFVNKLAIGGYDGKGVQIIRSNNDIHKCFSGYGLIEECIDIDKEISVIVCRNSRGEISNFPPVECVFDDEVNLVDYVLSPVQINSETTQECIDIACSVITNLEMIGILAVELFVDKKGQVFVNEVAPRPHNSGHLTIEGNYTSQYSQLLNILTEKNFGDTSIRCRSAMINIVAGDIHGEKPKYLGLDYRSENVEIYPHLYGKSNVTPFRKLGHVTLLEKMEGTLEQEITNFKSQLIVRL